MNQKHNRRVHHAKNWPEYGRDDLSTCQAISTSVKEVVRCRGSEIPRSKHADTTVARCPRVATRHRLNIGRYGGRITIDMQPDRITTQPRHSRVPEAQRHGRRVTLHRHPAAAKRDLHCRYGARAAGRAAPAQQIEASRQLISVKTVGGSSVCCSSSSAFTCTHILCAHHEPSWVALKWIPREPSAAPSFPHRFRRQRLGVGHTATPATRRRAHAHGGRRMPRQSRGVDHLNVIVAGVARAAEIGRRSRRVHQRIAATTQQAGLAPIVASPRT